MVSLSEIIKQSIDFISYQLNDEVNQYEIENQIKKVRRDRSFADNIMTQILKSWSVDSEKVILILHYEHDSDTIAYKMDSIDELNRKLKSDFYHLNPFISYVIPIVKGKVKTFKMFDQDDNEIIKEEIGFNVKEYLDHLKIKWD
ncbi:hypothetical protein [Flammeovirga sp. SJP92]|uniref:hypothetical protein n=1 Tax=Flammeovirga sp. SJP92 TaxID=1775430 RepID=UPI0007879E07|nr:hypothetical protein [Flammeovirga sp. SJP92]KXX70951.1 hypothetical protein AVL50_10835 [Flammeovirga sp. SJP92]